MENVTTERESETNNMMSVLAIKLIILSDAETVVIGNHSRQPFLTIETEKNSVKQSTYVQYLRAERIIEPSRWITIEAVEKVRRAE